MEFLDPKTDVGFKRLFGSQERAELTVSFLNSILERKEGELITEITIQDTANHPTILDDKISFVDVNCTDQKGKKYIIEMQYKNEGNFVERAEYYTAFFLARQLKHKDSYKKLIPVIFVGVVNYEQFANTSYLSHHFIMDSKTGDRTMNHLEFHFIELTKFEKSLDQLTTMTEKWVYLIKNADKMKQVPTQLKKNQPLVDALHTLESGTWTDNEMLAYMAELDIWRRKKGMEEIAEEERAKGLAKGKAEGLAKGKAEGADQKAIEIAINSLSAGIDIKMIAKITGMTVEKIKNLKKKLKN